MYKTDAVYTIFGITKLFKIKELFLLMWFVFFPKSISFLILPILCSQFMYSHIVELLPKYIPSSFLCFLYICLSTFLLLLVDFNTTNIFIITYLYCWNLYNYYK